MIPKECKRLAEVDFPIALVSRHAAQEKSIRHGHPSTLHLWWARRPLASCRAMLLGLLWPDPCDAHCPEEFKEEARRLLPQVPSCNPGATDEELRKALLRFIGDFANWKLASNSTYLSVSRTLVKAAHGEEPPLVVDPFAGGGSIPLEALRLGCETFASDLNPVACMILKVMLEDIPRHGAKLAEDLRQAGEEIQEKVRHELRDFYPDDPDGAKPIACLWARTVRCEAPNCGAEIPLMRSFWLCKKSNRKRALRPHVEHAGETPPRVRFEIFEPKFDGEVASGTIDRARATCVCCGTVLPPERVREQLAAQKGGADVTFDMQGNRTGGAQITTVVTLRSDSTGRQYRLPSRSDYHAVRVAQERIVKILQEWERDGKRENNPIPDEPLPPIGTLGFRVQRYGMVEWGDLFTARQKVALGALGRELSNIDSHYILGAIGGLLLGRLVDYMSAQCVWHIPKQLVAHTFGRQALPITWDFCEIFPFSDGPGNFNGAVQWIAKVAEAWPQSDTGQIQLADATNHPIPDQTTGIWFTDPPYYDAIPYADLSDFFLVWFKRMSLDNSLLRDPFDPSNPLSPKSAEAVQDETKQVDGQSKDREWFEGKMAEAFAEGRRVLNEDGIGSVVFAHKTTEGWEALLSGLIQAGWTVTGSWPIATEMGSRLRARDSAALATSIHLVCRPRAENTPVGDWADVLRELPNRVVHWMERLQSEDIRGADLIFACIGPALEIFSRYTRVETAEGREVGLAEYLEKVWEIVGRTALENVLGTGEEKVRDGLTGALEEDARLTALFLWALQSTNSNITSNTIDDSTGKEEVSAGKSKGYSLIFDVVRRFAQPLGIDLPRWENRIIETSKGVVRLMAVTERGRQLFGEDGIRAISNRLELEITSSPNPFQGTLFPDIEDKAFAGVREPRAVYGNILPDSQTSDGNLTTHNDATTLDRIHAAMLLQSSGRSQALRRLLKSEREHGADFLRLANALSALYPVSSEEKRLLDAMLLAVPK